jgi:hypothetical protein
MRRKILLGLTITTSLTAPAAAESWYGIYSAADIVAYADADSIARKGNIVHLEVMFSHFSDDYHKQSFEIDCANYRYRIMAASDYGANRQYLSTPEFETGWAELDQSMLQIDKNFACDGSNRTLAVMDPFADAEDYWYYYYYYNDSTTPTTSS